MTRSRSLAAPLAALLATPLAAQGPIDGTDSVFVAPWIRHASITQIQGLAWRADGHLFASDGAASLLEIDPLAATVRTRIAGLPLSSPARIALGDGRPGLGTDLVLADWNTTGATGCCTGQVLAVDPTTWATRTIAAGSPIGAVADPFGVALGPGGLWGQDLFVSDFQGASALAPGLFTIDASGTATLFANDPQWTTTTELRDLAFAPIGPFGGDLFVSDRAAGSAGVWRVTPTAGVTPFLAAPSTVTSVAFAPGTAFPAGLYLTVIQSGRLQLLRADAAGQLTLLSNEIPAPHIDSDTAFDGLGQQMALGNADTLYLVLPATLPLAIQPDPAGPGQTITATATGGNPNDPVLLFVDRIGPLRYFPPERVATGAFDATGTYRFSLPVPAGASGLDVRAQVVTRDAAGVWAASNKATVRFR